LRHGVDDDSGESMEEDDVMGVGRGVRDREAGIKLMERIRELVPETR